MEYAPFQKIPKRRTRKKDPKCGTIEQDPEYLKFLESLEQPEEVSLPSIDTYIEEIESREKEIKGTDCSAWCNVFRTHTFSAVYLNFHVCLDACVH